ncbi:hypothetical protein, partial [Streptosporangium saharense]|uniref:hypothetical protein n=1 Tax=Streptosporangium saharense TaxID=1706840 RepID=UPI003325863F
MSKSSAPGSSPDTPTRDGCGCFADAVPLPMGCARCGHSPYAHGCSRQDGHEYVQPSGLLMDARLQARREYGPQALPAPRPPVEVAPGEVVPLVPAQGRPVPELDPEPGSPAVAPAATAEPDLLSVPADDPVAVPASEPVASVRPARPPLSRRTRRPFPRVPRSGISWARLRRPGLSSGGVRPATGRCRVPQAHPVCRPGARVAVPYGTHPSFSCPVGQARLAITSRRHASGRITEVQIMHNTTPNGPAIPGWRLIVSDTGRYWAIRNRAFPRVALRAGVEPAVDADTFEEVQAAVAEQEDKARTAVAAAEKTAAVANAEKTTLAAAEKAAVADAEKAAVAA